MVWDELERAQDVLLGSESFALENAGGGTGIAGCRRAILTDGAMPQGRAMFACQP